MTELDRRRRRKHKIKTRTEAYNNKLEEVSLSGRKRNTHCWRLTAAEGDKGGGGWCLCACVRACEQCSATQPYYQKEERKHCCYVLLFLLFLFLFLFNPNFHCTKQQRTCACVSLLCSLHPHSVNFHTQITTSTSQLP